MCYHCARPCPGAPNPIPVLYAVARRPADVELIWDDSPVDADHAAAERYPMFRSVTFSGSGYAQFAEVLDTPAVTEAGRDPGALGELPPHSNLHFYRVSAINSAGDSGDLP